MPLLQDDDNIDPELIDFLIEKEKKDKQDQYERPFLQLPVPELPPIPIKEEEIEEDSGVIVVDI
tara:strand:+ start:302 stop:493 length:192 start_codon:yes stop_codon:yes gene_type:complete